MEADVQQFRWQKSAKCNGVPSYIFFPEERELPGFREDPQYKEKTFEDFCGQCRVRSVCKEFALLHDTYGIWGGTTKPQRDRFYGREDRQEMRAMKAEVGRYKPLHGGGEVPVMEW